MQHPLSDSSCLLAARKIKLDEAELKAWRPDADSRVLQGDEELHEEQRELIERCFLVLKCNEHCKGFNELLKTGNVRRRFRKLFHRKPIFRKRNSTNYKPFESSCCKTSSVFSWPCLVYKYPHPQPASSDHDCQGGAMARIFSATLCPPSHAFSAYC